MVATSVPFAGTCEICGGPLVSKRHGSKQRTTCSDACRQRKSKAKRKTVGPPQRPHPKVTIRTEPSPSGVPPAREQKRPKPGTGEPPLIVPRRSRGAWKPMTFAGGSKLAPPPDGTLARSLGCSIREHEGLLLRARNDGDGKWWDVLPPDPCPPWWESLKQKRCSTPFVEALDAVPA